MPSYTETDVRASFNAVEEMFDGIQHTEEEEKKSRKSSSSLMDMFQEIREPG
jgi:hypothetical protein